MREGSILISHFNPLIMNHINRKQFLKTLGLGSVLMGSNSLIARPFFQEDPQLDRNLVKEFVGAGHGKMERVKEMLAEHPTLLNSAHDWKHGDFETALGAASHVGNKEIAQWLIDKGAQANIFTAALFGKMDILKPLLEFFPQSLHAKGPHGYTLLHHAVKGGEDALEVKEYLESLGLKETRIPLY
jgi:hypothetical protein